MRESRNARSGVQDLGRVDGAEDNALILTAIGDNSPPRVDYERMAEARSPSRQRSVLAGRGDITAVLDCPRAVEHVPMRFSGDLCEGRRHSQQVCARLGQLAEQVREAQV